MLGHVAAVGSEESVAAIAEALRDHAGSLFGRRARIGASRVGLWTWPVSAKRVSASAEQVVDFLKNARQLKRGGACSRSKHFDRLVRLLKDDLEPVLSAHGKA